MLLKITLICLALLTIFALGYLAACAGAERWLTLREWWGSTKGNIAAGTDGGSGNAKS